MSLRDIRVGGMNSFGTERRSRSGIMDCVRSFIGSYHMGGFVTPIALLCSSEVDAEAFAVSNPVVPMEDCSRADIASRDVPLTKKIYDKLIFNKKVIDGSSHLTVEEYIDLLDIQLDPQIGRESYSIENMIKIFKGIAAYGNAPVSDELVKEVEAVLALFITLSGCQDYIAASGAIFLYVRTWFDTSVCLQIKSYVEELFEMTPHDGDEKKSISVDGEEFTPDWLKLVRAIRENWNAVKGNKLFDHVSKLLGLIVCTGMCKASSLTFSVKEYKLFEPDLKIVHGEAVDIADAAFGTVTFFVENMYMCYQEKSLAPLLISDRSASEIDEEYANVVLWWSLVKNGNLESVANMSEQEFDRRLEDLATRIKNLLSVKNTSFEKKLIQDKFMRLLQIKNDFVTMKIACGVRRAPFCLEFVGDSSQGKTTIADQLVDAMLASASLPISKDFRATLNPDDDFWVNWKSSMLVANLDDAANAKTKFQSKPPTIFINEIANNAAFSVKMADLESKGKVFCEPEILTVNTNVKDLCAGSTSNCPYSIQRRMHYVITVRAKRKFQIILDGKPQGLDSSKVRAHYAEQGYTPVFDDIWELDIEKAVKPNELETVADYAAVEWKGKKMAGISFRTAIQFCIEKFHMHRTDQFDIIERMNSRTTEIEKCSFPNCNNIAGYCDEHDDLIPGCASHLVADLVPHVGAEPEFGDKIVSGIQGAGATIWGRIKKDCFGLGDATESMTAGALLLGARVFAKHWDWMWVVPTPWLQSKWFSNILMVGYKDKLRKKFILKSVINWSQAIIPVVAVQVGFKCPAWTAACTLALGTISFSRQKCFVDEVKEEFRASLVDRNCVVDCLKVWRDENCGRIIKAAGIVGAIYTLSKVYRSWRADKPQGSLEPKTAEDVAKRDAEGNPYSELVTRAVEAPSEAARTTTSGQLECIVRKNLVYGTVNSDAGNLMVNGLFLTSNVVVIPQHYFTKDVLDVTFRKCNPEQNGGKFAARIARKTSHFVPDSDLAICYCSTGSAFKDIRRYFTAENVPQVHFQLLYREKTGNLIKADGLNTPSTKVSNRVANFVGGTYASISMNTFAGLCGATLISKCKPSVIIGFHLGGRDGTKAGCYGHLSTSQIDTGLEELRSIEGVLLSGSAGHFDVQSMGVKILDPASKPHPKSPLNFMPKDSQISYHGSCPGAVTYKSEFQVTPMSEHIIDVMDQPNIWNAPKFKPEWWAWQKCLENMSIPALPYDHYLLEKAIIDYKAPLLPIFRSNLWKTSRPLTEQENLCGIPGVKFVDAIKSGTAVGFPLVGPKLPHMEELPPTPELPVRRKLGPLMCAEVERCEVCYAKGERANPVAKAAKKDEIVKGEKGRIYFVNPFALTYEIRKYFLPIVRVLQMNPLVAECAVGINCNGPEWDEFENHVKKFGEDRLFGGDYGKYDQKLPSQLILAALRILIDFAKECDYSPEDIKKMEAMCGDIVYAYIAYNGDMISLTEGSHISGNSLTVFINSICGSLNMRCYFYSREGNLRTMSFRDFVAFCAYGDDNIGSVSKALSNFTIAGASKFLKEYGQVYTMPDKTSELADFLDPGDFEFLKRKGVYHEALGLKVGALSELSIFKSLHCFMKPKVHSEQLACALNIDGALREWFNHGKDVYEKRRSQLRVVADRTGISHLVTLLDSTYEDRVEYWKERYAEDYVVFDTAAVDEAFGGFLIE